MIRITSAGIRGLNAFLIDVEVDVTRGLHVFRIVGLPDKAVGESRERISAAITHSGGQPPGYRNIKVTVNLAPADIKKEGPAYDLPIALGYLAATEQVRFDTNEKLFVGELALDGTVRPVHGTLAIAQEAKRHGIHTLFVPSENAEEAAIVSDLTVIPVDSLAAIMAHLDGRIPLDPAQSQLPSDGVTHPEDLDIRHVRGQEIAKRALTIAAAGGHNALLTGPPGSGKTLLARAMTTILPPLTHGEMLEATTIASVMGLLPPGKALVTRRPFRSPHHTASAVSVIGGGRYPMPGEVTLAHHGVLFLDEFPEFRRDVLESLRQPLEDHVVTIARAEGHATFPASFSLIAAMNPCPCGFRNDPHSACTCTAGERARYERKLSGPLLDRIDLHAVVGRVSHAELTQSATAAKHTSSDAIRNRVTAARQHQSRRFAETPYRVNADMNVPAVKQYCRVNDKGETLLRERMNSHTLSARGYHRTLKVARTIADLDNRDTITHNDVNEALTYRTVEP